MEKGNIIKTPRFLNVEIKEILLKDEAKKEGYTEPTHFWAAQGLKPVLEVAKWAREDVGK